MVSVLKLQQVYLSTSITIPRIQPENKSRVLLRVGSKYFENKNHKSFEPTLNKPHDLWLISPCDCQLNHNHNINHNHDNDNDNSDCDNDHNDNDNDYNNRW